MNRLLPEEQKALEISIRKQLIKNGVIIPVNEPEPYEEEKIDDQDK